MKKKYILILVSFLIICLCLPFFVGWLYSAWVDCPDVIASYSQSDVLGYVSTTVGLLFGLLAIILSIRATEIDINVHHALTVSENNKSALQIEICNNSPFDCAINSVEICNKKTHTYSHILWVAPFDVKAKNSLSYVVEVEEIKKVLARINKNGKRNNITYCIRLSGNNTLYLPVNDLFKYLDYIGEV